MSNTRKKRGRPIKPDAKRNGINLRLSAEEADMLCEMSEKSGKTRTDILLDGVRQEIEKSRMK